VKHDRWRKGNTPRNSGWRVGTGSADEDGPRSTRACRGSPRPNCTAGPENARGFVRLPAPTMGGNGFRARVARRGLPGSVRSWPSTRPERGDVACHQEVGRVLGRGAAQFVVGHRDEHGAGRGGSMAVIKTGRRQCRRQTSWRSPEGSTRHFHEVVAEAAWRQR